MAAKLQDFSPNKLSPHGGIIDPDSGIVRRRIDVTRRIGQRKVRIPILVLASRNSYGTQLQWYDFVTADALSACERELIQESDGRRWMDIIKRHARAGHHLSQWSGPWWLNTGAAHPANHAELIRTLCGRNQPQYVTSA